MVYVASDETPITADFETENTDVVPVETNSLFNPLS